MNLEDYIRLANRTAKPLPSPIAQLVHGALGMGSEAGELSESIAKLMDGMALTDPVEEGSKITLRTNIVEEISDGAWYCAYLAGTFGFDLDQMIHHNVTVDPNDNPGFKLSWHMLHLTKNAGEVLTIAKAAMIYGKPYEIVVVQAFCVRAMRNLWALATLLGLDFWDEVLPHNIAKLKKRFPNAYSDNAALERADKAGEIVIMPLGTPIMGLNFQQPPHTPGPNDLVLPAVQSQPGITATTLMSAEDRALAQAGKAKVESGQGKIVRANETLRLRGAE